MEKPEDLQMLLNSITRSTYIEIEVTNVNANKLTIPRQSKLDNSLILGVQAFKIDDAAVLPNSALPNVANDVFNKTYATFEDSDSNQFIERIPLKSLDKIANAGERYITNYQIVNFENSYLEIPTPASVSLNTGFLLTVDYIYLRDIKALGIDPNEMLRRFKNA